MTFQVGDLFTTRYPDFPGPYEVIRITKNFDGEPFILATKHGAFFLRMCDKVEENSSYEPEDWS